MIRKYDLKDTDALVSVWQAASVLAHPFLSQEFLAQEAENMRRIYLPNAETWVVVENDIVLGFIALIGDEIGGLFVDPSAHGKGLGRSLVDHARACQDVSRVDVFERNTLGRGFYDRYGFVEAGRSVHAASGEVVLHMTLKPR